MSWLAHIWRSIFQGPVIPESDRDRKTIVFHHLLLHFRPIRVPARTLQYTHTFGLGGMSLVLFLLLVGTGVLMLFVYQPAPGGAYESVQTLQHEVLFGDLIRGMHYWSANLLVVVLLLHLLRVYLTGAYFAPRQFNWIIGLGLLCCALFSNLTGYLLPWDQLAYWATTIVTGMISYVPVVGTWLQRIVLGGTEVGSSTLIIFYALHTTVLPVTIVALMAFHFWRIRKARGVVIPRAPEEQIAEKPEYELFLPNLLMREFAVALVLIALVMTVALFFGAPLGEAANPGMSTNPAKAPWYFMGFQELQLHFHPLFGAVLMPLLIVLGLLTIPYLRYDRETSGILLAGHAGRRLGLAAVGIGAVAAVVWVLADEWWLDPGSWLPGIPAVLSEGVLPALVLLGLVLAIHTQFKRRADFNNESIQASFLLVLSGFLVLTVIGIWFRGPGMALVWPWNL